MKVNEIFVSIQGESTYAGLPCLFIRAAECNLRCTYCDTQYAYTDGTAMAVSELLEIVRNCGVNLVEITGGEPLLQNDVPELVRQLLEEDYTVLVETNGSVALDLIDSQAVRIMDIKCPSSEMSDRNDFSNIQKLQPTDEVKFVITTYEDYCWANNIIDTYQLDKKVTILLSPVLEKLPPKQLAEWILRDKKNVRLQLQLHKIIWGPDARGV